MSGNENIVLSVAELTAQGESMKALRQEYDAMFTKVSSILNEMNDGWSENLANNFSGKIITAQKGFSKILEMLECGENVAKEAASSFEEINAVMARQISGAFSNLFENINLSDLSSMVGTGINMDLIKEVWSNSELGSAWNSIKDTISDLKDGEIMDVLSKLEGEIFGTDYLSTTDNSIDIFKDLFEGKFSSDTVDKLTNVIDIDALGKTIGFSDGTGMGIIVDGVKRIFGDGETIESIDPIMIEYVDKMEGVMESFENGDYLEGVTGAVFYSLEGSTKLVTDIIVDGATNIVDTALDVTGLDEVIPWSDINDSLQNVTGIDFAKAIPEIGQGMSDNFSKMVEETVEGVPIIVDYVGEQIGTGIDYVGDLFSEAGSAIASWLDI